MIGTVASFTPKRGQFGDARKWVVGISTTNLKFISILSQPIKKIPCFINISSIKIPILKKSTGLAIRGVQKDPKPKTRYPNRFFRYPN